MATTLGLSSYEPETRSQMRRHEVALAIPSSVQTLALIMAPQRSEGRAFALSPVVVTLVSLKLRCRFIALIIIIIYKYK